MLTKTELISLAKGYASGLVSMNMLEEELEHDEIDLVLDYANNPPDDVCFETEMR